MNDDNVLQEIIKEQVRLELNNRDFARLLGIDESAWSRIRRGQRKLTLASLAAVAQKLPNLQLVILNYMAGGGNKNG